jgi:hypothetical protein
MPFLSKYKQLFCEKQAVIGRFCGILSGVFVVFCRVFLW